MNGWNLFPKKKFMSRLVNVKELRVTLIDRLNESVSKTVRSGSHSTGLY